MLCFYNCDISCFMLTVFATQANLHMVTYSNLVLPSRFRSGPPSSVFFLTSPCAHPYWDNTARDSQERDVHAPTHDSGQPILWLGNCSKLQYYSSFRQSVFFLSADHSYCTWHPPTPSTPLCPAPRRALIWCDHSPRTLLSPGVQLPWCWNRSSCRKFSTSGSLFVGTGGQPERDWRSFLG